MKKLIFTMLTLALILPMMVILTGCNDRHQIATRVDAPGNLRFDSNTLTLRWDEPSIFSGDTLFEIADQFDAIRYTVFIGNTLINNSLTATHLTFSAEQLINNGTGPLRVQAIALSRWAGQESLTSPFAEFVIEPIQLTVPQNLTTNDGAGAVITWDSVPNALGYGIYLDGRRVGAAEANHNIFNLQNVPSVFPGLYTVQVRALGNGISVLQSALTNNEPTITFNVPSTLGTPTNFRFDLSNRLAWSHVTGSNAYRIYVNGEHFRTSGNTNFMNLSTWDLDRIPVGSLIRIRAINTDGRASLLSNAIIRN
ncbi:MAG: hypothetical protein FWE31_02780 [Firmicutes bacterium]|nr:hypothetical protein [Bacillota bacterium]